MLNHLSLTGVGPAPTMELDFGSRLNIFTGDNGLGKTFLLDIAWWVLTRTWAGEKAWPRRGEQKKAVITFDIEGKTKSTQRSALFDPVLQSWRHEGKQRPPMPGLVLYMRIDGGFSLWDPARNYYKKWASRDYEELDRPAAFHFTKKELWEEKKDGDKVLCNGLLRDWVSWQYKEKKNFIFLEKMLEQLSPHDNEKICPAEPDRLFLGDVRDIPTIKLPYGVIPITLASAGMQRILSLAYLIVWAHTEHLKASELISEAPTDRFVILIDEVEAHLHPRWQRSLLPSILSVITKLGKEGSIQRDSFCPSVQILATTHAPLVMASIESKFCTDIDKIFNFDLVDNVVRIEELPWRKLGDATAWLTSEAFDLLTGRSREAEEAIDRASKIISGDVIDSTEVMKIHKKLQTVLGDMDPFWIRWRYVVERKGYLNDSSFAAE